MEDVKVCQLKERGCSNCSQVTGSRECTKGCSWYVDSEVLKAIPNVNKKEQSYKYKKFGGN